MAPLGNKPKNPYKAVLAGGIAGGMELFISYPTEYVKTQLQLYGRQVPPKYTGVVDCVKKTAKNHGFRGFYRGLSALLYGTIPKIAIRFGTFETLSNHVKQGDKLTSTEGFLCGLGAGVTEATLAGCFVQTVKTKFIHDQTQQVPKYRGFVHGVTTIIRQEGIRGVYQGWSATVLKQGTNQAIRFGLVNTFSKWYTQQTNREVSIPVKGVFGAVAGGISVLCNNPLDVIKTRMQGLEAKKYNGLVHCAKKVYREEGWKAFYKGTAPRLVRVCSDVALVFMFYDVTVICINYVWPENDE